jgi:hypothetical protein
MDLYKILNIKQDTTLNDIKKAYIKLAKIYHPDKNINKDNKKFQEINYAYNILINKESREKYNLMNNNTKSKFYTFINDIINSNITDTLLDNFKINIDKEYILNINEYLEKCNLNELILLFTKNIKPKNVTTDNTICSDTDINEWDENTSDYYNELPILYQKYNSNNIHLELNIQLKNIINNKLRTIKLKRNISNKESVYSFTFKTNVKYIVFHEGGDINENNIGHLIIKLNLPDNYIWENNYIYYIHEITLYNYIYGINMNLNFDKKYNISWIPIRDGKIIDIDKKLGLYNFYILLDTIYDHTNNKQTILQKYFN